MNTTRVAGRLAAHCGVEVPVCEVIRLVLDGEATPARALGGLMTRPLEGESEWMAVVASEPGGRRGETADGPECIRAF